MDSIYFTVFDFFACLQVAFLAPAERGISATLENLHPNNSSTPYPFYPDTPSQRASSAHFPVDCAFSPCRHVPS